MIVSYFSVSKVLDYLIKHYELYVWSVFFGMIIGSIYYINKDFQDWNPKTRLSLLLGIVCGLGISFLNPAKENDNLIFVFFCGMISVSGMTLPGFSGSFILILLGNYVLLLVDSVNALFDTFTDLITAEHKENNLDLRLLICALRGGMWHKYRRICDYSDYLQFLLWNIPSQLVFLASLVHQNLLQVLCVASIHHLHILYSSIGPSL